jgi:positive regulator of sigma E activity
MGYLKYTQYAYLVIAVLFIYDAITKINAGNDTPWLSFLIAGMGVFMFFFRRRFAKKFEDRNKQK